MILYQPGFAYDKQVTEDQAAGELILAREGFIDPIDLTGMDHPPTNAAKLEK